MSHTLWLQAMHVCAPSKSHRASAKQVSERAIVQVFERCHELEVVDIVPARWSAAQDLLLWQTVSVTVVMQPSAGFT